MSLFYPRSGSKRDIESADCLPAVVSDLSLGVSPMRTFLSTVIVLTLLVGISREVSAHGTCYYDGGGGTTVSLSYRVEPVYSQCGSVYQPVYYCGCFGGCVVTHQYLYQHVGHHYYPIQVVWTGMGGYHCQYVDAWGSVGFVPYPIVSALSFNFGYHPSGWGFGVSVASGFVAGSFYYYDYDDDHHGSHNKSSKKKGDPKYYKSLSEAGYQRGYHEAVAAAIPEAAESFATSAAYKRLGSEAGASLYTPAADELRSRRVAARSQPGLSRSSALPAAAPSLSRATPPRAAPLSTQMLIRREVVGSRAAESARQDALRSRVQQFTRPPQGGATRKVESPVGRSVTKIIAPSRQGSVGGTPGRVVLPTRTVPRATSTFSAPRVAPSAPSIRGGRRGRG